MPILGNLSEFPLPEILLLIGGRTGRLRLLDVPEFGLMDVDFSNGEVQALYLAGETHITSDAMIDKLSAVVQAQGGMFEFRVHPVASIQRELPLRINELVLALVSHVDEVIAERQAFTSPDHRYILAVPQPEIWIEPELSVFFHEIKQYLVLGASMHELAAHLQIDPRVVHTHLTNLRLLGLLKLINIQDTAQIKDLQKQEEIARRSNEFLRAARAAGEIQKITGRITKSLRPK
jgi:hypothetical protein